MELSMRFSPSYLEVPKCNEGFLLFSPTPIVCLRPLVEILTKDALTSGCGKVQSMKQSPAVWR